MRRPRPQGDGAVLRRGFAQDDAKQRGLAGPVSPHKAHARPGGKRRRSLVEERARPQPIGQIADVKHDGLLARAGPDVQRPLIGGAGDLDTVERALPGRRFGDGAADAAPSMEGGAGRR
jgi:hypothetical protein